jgi:hypothetical protein
MRVSTVALFSSAMLFAAGVALADPPAAPATPSAAPAAAPVTPPPQVFGVVMSLGFPTPIQMFAGGDPEPGRTQDVGAEYDLTNLTNAPVTLKANSDCESHSWTVTDAAGTAVDHSADCPQGGQPVTLPVPYGKTVSGQSTVSLHVFDYKEGQTYTIHYRAFGVESTANFTVTQLK